MKSKLLVTIIQFSIEWEQGQRNIDKLDVIFSGIVKGSTNVIVLPEMFTTGFTMEPSNIYEKMDGFTISWMKNKSKKLKAVICGSIIVKDKNKFYNRFLWIKPDGNVSYYDKQHLFSMAGEHKQFTAGKRVPVFEYLGWKICPQICYDLRFPELSRNSIIKKDAKYDVLIYVANWPQIRINAWCTLLTARAIENQCYVVGVNRIGKDGNGVVYNGQSRVVDMFGNCIYQPKMSTPQVYTSALFKSDLLTARAKFPVLKDKI